MAFDASQQYGLQTAVHDWASDNVFEIVRLFRRIVLMDRIERILPASLRLDRETIALPLARRSLFDEPRNQLIHNRR